MQTPKDMILNNATLVFVNSLTDLNSASLSVSPNKKVKKTARLNKGEKLQVLRKRRLNLVLR